MRDRDGFTLIELLIVVVIIGILASIAIPKFSSTREKAYFAAMKSDLKNLASQQEIYYSDTYAYTNVIVSLSYVSSSGVTATITGGTDGWSATATHAALGATDGCAIYYGNAAAVSLGAAVPIGPGDMACTQ
jgi:prepilin-type N-terminal cleavage/methylation domain-containing protein